MAQRLLCLPRMKTLAASAFALLILCGPALADSAAPRPPDSFQLHFALHDAGTSRIFDVIVSPDHPCATASEKRPNYQIELMACTSGDAHLDIDWSTRSPSGEYRSKSSVQLAHGATAELGVVNGPRLWVAVQ